MNKKLLAILIAGLLLLTAVSCGDDKPSGDESDTKGSTSADSYMGADTDEWGNTVTAPDSEEVTVPNDNDELNPTFTEISKKVVIITAVATVRDKTIVDENTAIGWPKEGTILDVTGESENWYRITYNEKEAYIAKTVAADASALEGFSKVEGDGEQVVISTGNEGGAVYVRSYPSSESEKSIRATLKEGTVVTRVAVGEKWSRILYEETSETETDAEGNPAKTVKEYYISNDCIKNPADTEASSANAD